jgi:hypothetical protein
MLFSALSPKFSGFEMPECFRRLPFSGECLSDGTIREIPAQHGAGGFGAPADD